MAITIDREAIIEGFQEALKLKQQAAELGQKLADRVDRIYFVACGAPNRTMLGLQYWLEHFKTSFEVRRYYPAEFMTLEPLIDERTLVVLGSKSGTTQETVEAARWLQGKPAITVAVTQTAELPLAQAVQYPLLVGETEQSYTAMYIVLQALVAGLLKRKDDWPLYDKLMRSLDALPAATVEAAVLNDRRSVEEARLYKDDRIIYHVAAGPVFTTAYVFGVCMLMEMQWMHSTALEAAEFFHGPFEIVDHTIPLVLLLGEDPSRPLMERVVRFCRKYTERLMIYDSKDFPMTGVDPEIRPFFAPYILQAALNRIAERLAIWHNQPLSTRRYMWKTEY